MTNTILPIGKYAILNTQTAETYSSIELQTIEDAENVAKRFNWPYQIKKVACFDAETTEDQNNKTDLLDDENASTETIADRLRIVKGEHILIGGEVQVGKLNVKHESIVKINQKNNLPVLLLFRNNNVDFHQFMGRLDAFNDKQRHAGKPTIPQPVDILSHKGRLHHLLKDAPLILGLANQSTLRLIEECLDKHTYLQGRLCVIIDEADLVTFELEGEGVKTQTEDSLSSLFPKIHSLISVTGTPASILLCDKITQVYTVDRPDNYFGIDRINHIPVNPIRCNKKNVNYDPYLDDANLTYIMNETLQCSSSTLLILVSRLRREHKNVISYLNSKYSYLGKDIVYLELNEKSVKVYDGFGTHLPSISAETTKKTKVGPIDIAIQEYLHVPHIVIVAGVLAGRGVSFVSTDYSRHLTHQYIADPEGCNLESAMQSVRLLGKYNDNPELTLYCSQSLYKDMVNQCADMFGFMDLAKQARSTGDVLPDILRCQNDYNHKWLPARKQKGISFQIERERDYDIVIEDYSVDERRQNKYVYESILTNTERNYPFFFLNDAWPGGTWYPDSKTNNKERVIYCNPLSDFTTEGVMKYLHDFPVNRKTAANKLRQKEELDKMMARAAELYQKFPQYQGKVLRRKHKTVKVCKNIFTRRDQ